MNEAEIFWIDDQPKETQGFHNVLVTEGHHPWWSNWWPHGHIIGWEHTFVHEINHLLDASSTTSRSARTAPPSRMATAAPWSATPSSSPGRVDVASISPISDW
jgi:hypothetical protein